MSSRRLIPVIRWPPGPWPGHGIEPNDQQGHVAHRPAGALWHATDLLREQRLGLSADSEAAAGIEVLVTLADELCAAAPRDLVIDDLQWADDASLMVWLGQWDDALAELGAGAQAAHNHRNDELCRVGSPSHSIPVMPVHLMGVDRRLMESAAMYTIRLNGHLGDTFLSAFPALEARRLGAHTVLTGVLDRSALFGVLAEIEALGLELLELSQHEGPEAGSWRTT